MYSQTFAAAASVALLFGLVQANGNPIVNLNIETCSGIGKCQSEPQNAPLGGKISLDNRPASSVSLVGIQPGGPGQTFDLSKVTCTISANHVQHKITNATSANLSTNTVELQWVDCEYNAGGNSTSSATTTAVSPTTSANGTARGNSTLSTTGRPGGPSTTRDSGATTTGASGSGTSATGSSASATGTSGLHNNGAATASVSSFFALAVAGLMFGYVL